MSNVRELPRSGRTYDEASAWIAKMDRGLSPSEKQELGAWLGHGSSNRETLMRISKLWDRMDALTILAEANPSASKPVSAGFRPLWAVAASLLLATAILGWLAVHSGEGAQVEQTRVAESPLEYMTEIGQQASHVLPDGTRLTLNTNTRVRLQYSESNRLLLLEQGEIHVMVAHQPGRPLSVAVGGQIVQAVGTEFNVEITSDQRIELVVTEGVVMVGVVDGSVLTPVPGEPIALTRSSTLVAAGESAVIPPEQSTSENVKTEAIGSEEIAVKLSWREGNVIFRGEPLEEALAEIGRYTAVEFVILDESAKKIRIAGLFRAGDVDGLLKALRQNFNISYERVGDDKILLGGE